MGEAAAGAEEYFMAPPVGFLNLFNILRERAGFFGNQGFVYVQEDRPLPVR
jgi:hypothetical protein